MTVRYADAETAWIGIGEAARLLGVSVDTVRRWDSEGKICSRRTLGNHRQFKISDVEALLSGEKATA